MVPAAMIRHFGHVVLCLAAAGIGAMTWSALSAQEPTPRAKADELAALRKQIDETVDSFKLSTVEDKPRPLKPRRVLRWDNNARGSELGLTVLYVAGGRPEVVCCIYPWKGQLNHEFGSLSRGLLRVEHRGEIVWQPPKPSVTYQPIPNAERPANSATKRLRQIKALSGRFTATLLGWEIDNSDRQKLRRLTRPIYRYEKPTGDVIDGAVYAFVMGVDPEVLLVIEAVRSDDGPRFEYAFARRTSGELEGCLDGQRVWTAKRGPEFRNPAGLNRTVVLPLGTNED